MKRVFIPLFILFLLLSQACNQDTLTTSSIQPSLSVLFSSRTSDNDHEELPEGSHILLNAQGGLELKNELFTLSGAQWCCETNLEWNDLQKETSITALYPVYEDKSYSFANLYTDKGLEDILIAQDTFSTKSKIELNFKHLFAKLTININPSLLEGLNEIRLTVPTIISDISTKEGTLSLTEESHTTVRENNGSSEYSFLVPPLTNCTLSLTLIRSDNSLYETNLAPHTFESGFQYTCNLLPNDSRPGIRTAEDLIAFSQLINGKYEGDKTLADFGEQVNGTTIYRLLEDIVFTEEECSRLQPIGGLATKAFSDTFDGEGHTISKLILPDESALNKYTGLFGYLDSAAVVKNIHIDQATSVTNPYCNQTGIIAAKNYGTIDHCSVTNSKIYSVEYGSIGLISANSSGYITNCYSQNNTIQVQSYTYAGGIAGTAEGYILNCFTQDNTFIEKGTKHRVSCIIGASSGRSRLTIENCYTHHSTSNTYWGAAIGTSNKATIKGFYYNKGSYYYEKTSTTSSNIYKYDTNYCINSSPVIQLLNEWIATTGDNTYKEHKFRSWNMEDERIYFSE